MSAVRFLDSRALRASGGMPRLSYATATATAAQPYNWKRDTNELLNATEVAAEQSAKQRTATIQVQEVTQAKQEDMYAKTNDKLQQQLQATSTLKAQLEDCLRRTEEEIATVEYQRKVTYADQNALQEPLFVANECLKSREYRPAREKNRDHFERALVDQAAAVQNSINSLSSGHHACTAELERLLAMKDIIERDIGDKAHSLAIDEQCLNMQPGQYPLQPIDLSAPGVDMAMVGSIGAVQTKSGGLPYVWKQSSGNIMDEAYKAMATAQRVRAESEAVRSDAASIEADARAKVNDSARRKLEETAQLRAQLEGKLEQTVQEANDIEFRRASVEKSLAAKMEPLAVAQQRLMVRKQRAAREQIRDEVELAIEAEVATLRNQIAALSNEQNKLKSDFAKLQEAQHQLELDIQDKAEAMRIDRQCLELQARIPELMDEKLRLYH